MSEFSVEAWYKSIYQSFSMLSPPSSLSDFLGNEVGVKGFAKVLTFIEAMPAHRKLMFDIHSELTNFERRFVYGFFSKIWSGKGNVLEVGPFLGSSSRAICLGMLMNERREPGMKLYTYDKFEEYYTDEEQFALLKKCIPEDIIEHLRQTGSFKECFDHLHQNQEYSHLLEADYGVLPGSPEEISSLKNCFRLADDIDYDTVFVDGAKSWYGTKYFFKAIAKHVKPGAYIIFQDYGHYTCFWLSVFVAMLKHNFRLCMSIDNTYTFELLQPLDEEEIDANFPDHPSGIDAPTYDALYLQELKEANLRSDTHACLALCMHHAAALAYIGDFETARLKLLRLAAQPYFSDYLPMINAALKSPTYTPDGDVLFPA